MRVVGTLILVALGTSSALAATPFDLEGEVSRRHGQKYDACIAGSKGYTVAILDCIAAETARHDARLNLTYRRVMAGLSSERKVRLRASERDWIRKRDISCEARAIRLVGDWATMTTMRYESCILAATIRRTILLERYATGRTTLADLGRDPTR